MAIHVCSCGGKGYCTKCWGAGRYRIVGQSTMPVHVIPPDEDSPSTNNVEEADKPNEETNKE